MFGLRRCDHVTPHGLEQQLVPDPGSDAGRRTRFENDHPALSRFVGHVSVVLLVVGLGVVVLELVDTVGPGAPAPPRVGGAGPARSC
jgi:hypothetical protein